MKVVHLETSKSLIDAIERLCNELNYDYQQVNTFEEASVILKNLKFGVFISNFYLNSNKTLLDIISNGLIDVKNIFTIVLSSESDFEIRNKLFNLGVSEYIFKDAYSIEKIKSILINRYVTAKNLESLKKLKIAVLDDDVIIHHILKSYFNFFDIKNVDFFINFNDYYKAFEKVKYDINIIDLILKDSLSIRDIFCKLPVYERVFIGISGLDDFDLVSMLLDNGLWDFIPKPFTKNVFFAKLLKAYRLFEYEKKLMEKNKLLDFLAKHDAMLECYNHNTILSILKDKMKEADRYGENLSIAMFDIDYFKAVNDTYGHQIGDSLLKELVDLIKSNIRGTDKIGRYGGEEFLIIFQKCDKEQAKKRVEYLLDKIRKTKFTEIQLDITVSAGVTQYQKHEELKELIKRVDLALYSSKENGRDRVTVF